MWQFGGVVKTSPTIQLAFQFTGKRIAVKGGVENHSDRSQRGPSAPQLHWRVCIDPLAAAL